MTTSASNRLAVLHAQHSLQGDDLLTIYQLASAEGVTESLEVLNFEEFTGFSFYLFITTQSAQTREQLAQLLHKFGSDAVLPLIKISRYFQLSDDLKALTVQSLERMTPYTLAIGLDRVLNESDHQLRLVALERLVRLVREQGDAMRQVLPQLLSPKNWQLLDSYLLERCPTPQSGAQPRRAQREISSQRERALISA
ncbi:MAG: hypothetical protein F6J97_13040 [Leptolyngbya sp. SIO4C1]|nr:hypothetical protein [Leptolyngbya sp. SIO4C1]